MSGTASPNPFVRPFAGARRKTFLKLMLGACLAATPVSWAQARDAVQPTVERQIANSLPGQRDIASFYEARGSRPLWVRGGRLAPEAERVVDLVSQASVDGLDPDLYRARDLAAAVERARSGDVADLAEADLLLSQAIANYARDLRRPASFGMVYVDRELAPRAPSLRAVLDGIAAAPSLSDGLAQAVQVNPLYASLREAYARQRAGLTEDQQQRVRASLERLRALPSDLGNRFILVDAAAAKLYMYEGGRARGSMRVVIGRPGEPTPIMAAYIRQMTLNPYWNVPPDLAQRLIAPHVVSDGPAYLRNAGYEVLSDWSPRARTLDGASINWREVAAGNRQVALRQLPGPRNSMGQMKFMFPNDLGVYLHDTPNRELFEESDRRRSGGCVRLEDAPRLARWLFGGAVPQAGEEAEEAVPLPQLVPVYITYLTAMPEGGRIVFNRDHYQRDRQLVAQLGAQSVASIQ